MQPILALLALGGRRCPRQGTLFPACQPGSSPKGNPPCDAMFEVPPSKPSGRGESDPRSALALRSLFRPGGFCWPELADESSSWRVRKSRLSDFERQRFKCVPIFATDRVALVINRKFERQSVSSPHFPWPEEAAACVLGGGRITAARNRRARTPERRRLQVCARRRLREATGCWSRCPR